MSAPGLADRPLTAGRLAGAAAVLLVLTALPAVLPVFHTLQVSYGLIFAIAALGFNLLLGYTGLLSFGHSAFFGTGAYVAALLVKYAGISAMEAFLGTGLLGSLVVAAIFGVVCVRYTRIFFGILALALSQVLWSLALKFFWVTGGTDGLRLPTPTLLGGAIAATLGTADDKTDFLAYRYYYYVLAVFTIVTAVMWVIVHSPFGKALQAIRDNEVRAEFVGVQVRRYRYLAFLISGTVTGLAGTLWVPLNGLTTPDILYWPFSGKIVFMVVLGGFRTFSGPIVGAFAFNYLETFAVGATVYWQLVLGLILVGLVLAMPAGLVGTASVLLGKLRQRPRARACSRSGTSGRRSGTTAPWTASASGSSRTRCWA
jgi:branched-chain amino acid transport system permease protein